ncbi:MAG TPA: tail fiber domain-containing protein [Trichocoleus sp.]
MTFKFTERKAGDVLQSSEWNAALYELIRLDETKINREGADSLEGPLTISGALTPNGQAGQLINLQTPQYGIGTQTLTTYFRSPNNFAWYSGGSHQNADFNSGGGTLQMVINNGKVGIGTANPLSKLDIESPWGDWLFLKQTRDVEGGGGFRFHNAWGNSNQAQGVAERNRLEIGYQSPSGETAWGQFVIHGPTGNVGIGQAAPSQKLDVRGNIKGTSLIASQQGGPYSSMATFESSNTEPPYVNWSHNRLGGAPVRYGYIQAGDFGDRKEFRFQAEQGANFVFGNGYLNAPAGAIFSSVAIGVDPPGDVNFPYPYETIGTTDTRWNLRLHSYNGIYFHISNQAVASKGVSPDGSWFGSTQTIKDNISDFTLQEALEVLEGLNPAKFTYKADQTQKPHAGFIAETVPDMIANADHTMISEMDIIAVLTKVVKEQQRLLSKLVQQLADS